MSRLIDLDDSRNCYIGMDGEYEQWNIDPNVLTEAQPARPTGKWEPVMDADENGEPYQSGVSCSECGHVETRETCFCSECGADMREEDEKGEDDRC